MNPALPVPFDVKVMNLAAAALFAIAALVLAAAGAWWALRHPLFSIGGITVQGEVVHNNAVTLRANVMPRLAGNFFTVNLAEVREAFDAVPWVRSAVVRREFPNRLRVSLEEHHAVALWGTDGEARLLNNFGEVFEANAGEVDAEDLPRLSGPQAQSAEVLAMYHTLRPMFENLDLAINHLALSARGSWRVQLDNGGEVELGRGTQQEVVARAQRLVQTITQVTSRYSRRPDALMSADLRHGDGYALRLKGVVTQTDVKK